MRDFPYPSQFPGIEIDDLRPFAFFLIGDIFRMKIPRSSVQYISPFLKHAEQKSEAAVQGPLVGITESIVAGHQEHEAAPRSFLFHVSLFL